MIRTMMSGGASVEETLELWASSLRGIKEWIRPLLTQERVAASAARFFDVLLGNEPRKTGWMRAEAAGDPGPWRQQALLGRGTWDTDALRDIVRDYAVEQLCDDKAVLVIDETGFLKQARPRAGLHDNIPVPRARSRTARSVCSRLMSPIKGCLHRPRALPAESLDVRFRLHGRGSCA
jgi:hypothetical protein